MRHILAILIAGTVILAGTADARIGETLEVCSKRYGDPVRTKLDENNTGVVIYEKNDLTIKIHFTRGGADLILYGPGEVARVDLETARYLLELNGRNKEWKQLTDTEETIYDVQDENAQYPRVRLVDPIKWITRDEVLEASYSDSKGSLEIRASTVQLRVRKGL